MCPNQHLSDKSEEVHHVHIPTKRLKAESNTIVVGFSKMCLIGTDDGQSELDDEVTYMSASEDMLSYEVYVGL